MGDDIGGYEDEEDEGEVVVVKMGVVGCDVGVFWVCFG